jgi:phosphoserine phosphatase
MIAEAVVSIYQLDGYLSTMFEVKNGVFTGKVLSTLANGKHIVKDIISKYKDNSLAVGDSENDISMLEQVKVPICINPSEELLLEAKRRNWLVINDKDAASNLRKIIEEK